MSKQKLKEISAVYTKQKGKYEILGANLAQALILFLEEEKIEVLSVNYRAKTESSFIEKIGRKNYESPLDSIEDICGIRIVCHYQSDISKIEGIVLKEFEVLESENKEELLGADQFGYRSSHFIVKIRNNWLEAPNYRGLQNLKAEIQIRTVLMHAWAEIEHKLAYKKSTHIPHKLKRSLYRISAKLEEADEQFEVLKNEILSYRKEIITKTKNRIAIKKIVELNLDSLQAFLDETFPERKRLTGETPIFLDELLRVGIEFSDLLDSYEKTKDYLEEIEIEEHGEETWVQVGIARVVMDVTNAKYRIARGSTKERYSKWKQLISNTPS